MEATGTKTLVFDASKKETHTPSSGYRHLHHKLRNEYKIVQNKEEITDERLANADVLILGGPREKYSAPEFDAMSKFVKEKGGSLAVFLGEGGETKLQTNVNYLLEQFGIVVNSDSVIRTVYYKYFHPREVCVTNGILNRGITRAAGKKQQKGTADDDDDRPVSARPSAKSGAIGGLTFVYPQGATLTVSKPAVPILSTGPVSYPQNRPVAAMVEVNNGRVLALGSLQMFDDEWLGKEENGKIADVMFRWLARTGENPVQLDPIDAEDPGVEDYHFLPDTAALAERLKSCLEEPEEISRDFTSLFDTTTFSMGMGLLPEVVQLHEHLGVKHEPLTLIPPSLTTPLPVTKAATFPPALADPMAPALDMFDLDESFASERVRLARLTNKCKQNPEDDLDFFIQQAAEVLNLREIGSGSPKEILYYVLQRLSEWKKVNHDMNQDPDSQSSDDSDSDNGLISRNRPTTIEDSEDESEEDE